MGICFVRLTKQTLGDVLALLGGKEVRDGLGKAFPLGYRYGVVWDGRLDVKTGAFNGELDGLSDQPGVMSDSDGL